MVKETSRPRKRDVLRFLRCNRYPPEKKINDEQKPANKFFTRGSYPEQLRQTPPFKEKADTGADRPRETKTGPQVNGKEADAASGRPGARLIKMRQRGSMWTGAAAAKAEPRSIFQKEPALAQRR